MAGASLKHNLVAANLARILIPALLTTHYTVMQNDMRVHNPLTDSFMYPDIVIVGEQIEMLVDGAEDTLLNPLVVIEILSKSTAEYDKTWKFEAYKQLESLQEYVLVEQHTPNVTVYQRSDTGEWETRRYCLLTEAATIITLNVSMPLANIYERILL